MGLTGLIAIFVFYIPSEEQQAFFLNVYIILLFLLNGQ